MATFCCHGPLQKLLTRRDREGLIIYRFHDHPGVKDAIEALGIPHTEVDVILANGRSVNFKHPLCHGDVIDVYPPDTPVPAAALCHLSPEPPDPVTFILDVHLGTLARRLRLLGFDSLYRNDYSDAEIMRLSLAQGRIILTRDKGILKHRLVRHGCLVSSDRVDEQVRQILVRYRLYDRIRPWLRCMACNGLTERVDKAVVAQRLEPKTLLYYDAFQRCLACDRLYWQGSHFEKIAAWLDDLLEAGPAKPV